MCNPMFVQRNDLVLEVILNNTNEMKLLDEWTQIINEHLPTPKRMNTKSMARTIKILSKDKIRTEKETINRSISYRFQPISEEEI